MFSNLEPAQTPKEARKRGEEASPTFCGSNLDGAFHLAEAP